MNWTALVQDYLDQRRKLGYQLTIEGRQLHGFADYAEQQGMNLPLTVANARSWAVLAPSGSPIAMARRVSLLRPFSRYLGIIDPASRLLPTGLLGPTHRRLPPYIFSEADIAGLMNACDSLFSVVGLRRLTMRTLIGLLVATGLRPGEAVRLKQQHVNLKGSELEVHDSKGWKRRIVPITKSTVAALLTYQHRRDRWVPCSPSEAFFVIDNGQPLSIVAADYAFKLLREHQGFCRQPSGRFPRLYDLRHTFVCNRLLSWYETGEHVDNLMLQLTQYIGHKKVSDTYWYIQSVPPLMNYAARRFETYRQNAGGGQ